MCEDSCWNKQIHPSAAATLSLHCVCTYLSRSGMMQAETQKRSGNNHRWREHVSVDPSPVADQPIYVWNAAGSENFESVQGLQVREWPQLAVEELAKQATEECWVYSQGANQVQRFQEKCDHYIILLLNIVCTSSLHLARSKKASIAGKEKMLCLTYNWSINMRWIKRL